MNLFGIQRWLRFFVLWGILTGGITARGQAIWIGYTNCVAVTNYSQSLMNQIAQLKWYFAHASVGECMMEGASNLHQMNPGFYQLQGWAVSSTPPGVTTNGVIYEDDRGNNSNNNYAGDWQWKINLFQSAVSNGWHYPLVNLAMNKPCFIDIWYTANESGVSTILSAYLQSMTNLEAAYPQTVFVYATMPLTTTNYSYMSIDTEPLCDYLRNVYNNSLRAWCSANNQVLFDIADIEAHDTNGNLVTFTYNGQAYEQLCESYNQGGDRCCGEIGDGAHPTNLEAEKLLARGFYALAAALLTTPVSIAGQLSTNGFALKVAGVPGFAYALEASTNLVSWYPVITNTSPLTFTDTNAMSTQPCYYRSRWVP